MLGLLIHLRELVNYRHPGPRRVEGELRAAVDDTLEPGKPGSTGQNQAEPACAKKLQNAISAEPKSVRACGNNMFLNEKQASIVTKLIHLSFIW